MRFGLVLGFVFFCADLEASPADVPLHHWSYEVIERLAARGLCSGLGLGMRPLTRDWVAAKVAEALKTIEERDFSFSAEVAYQIEEDLLKLSHEFAPELRRLEERVEEERETGQPFRWKGVLFHTGLLSEKILTSFDRKTSSSLIENSQGFRLRDGWNGRWRLPSWLSVGDNLALTLDPSLRAREEESDADIDFEEASLKIAYRNIELKGGELNFWWGPGYHGDLLLTNNPRPLRAFSLRTKEAFRLPWKLKILGDWQAQLFGARLEQKRTIPKPFLTGTRFEWSPHRRVLVGASHTAMFGGEGEEEGFEEFFNALDPTEGGGATERANHLLGGDLRLFLPELVRWVRLAAGFELYGEFYGEDTKGVYIPEFVSYLGGCLLTDLFSFQGLDFRFEGATTDPAAYEHFAYLSGYRFKQEFIGHAMGEDAEDIFFRLSKEFFLQDKRFVVGGQFDRERRGVSGAALSFGQVAQTKNEVQIDFTWQLLKSLELKAAYQFEDIDNFQGSTGVDSKNHIVSLQTLFRF